MIRFKHFTEPPPIPVEELAFVRIPAGTAVSGLLLRNLIYPNSGLGNRVLGVGLRDIISLVPY